MSEFGDFRWWLVDVVVAIALFAPGLWLYVRFRERLKAKRLAWLVLVVPAWVVSALALYPVNRVLDYQLPMDSVLVTQPAVVFLMVWWVVPRIEAMALERTLPTPELGPAARAFAPRFREPASNGAGDE
jgi:hypothetical protein